MRKVNTFQLYINLHSFHFHQSLFFRFSMEMIVVLRKCGSRVFYFNIFFLLVCMEFAASLHGGQFNILTKQLSKGRRQVRG